jgi:hypothetical protein
MSATPEEDPAARIRRLRSFLLRRAAGTDQAAREGDETLLREAVRRLHPAPMAQFLATDEAFLLTLDHRALTRNETPENMKRHRAEAADAIAVLVPHIKCAVTAPPLGTGPPPSLVTPVTFSAAEFAPPASPDAGNDAAKASAAPTTPEGFLRAAQQAVAGMPVPTTAPISPQALKVTVDAANTVASFLGGVSGFNPARLSVSIYVSDVMAATASGRSTLHRLSYIAAARVANARRLSLENAPMLSALDLAAAGLRTQVRVVDDRAAMRGHPCALSTWVSLGAADGWLGTIHDAAKQPPVYSTDIANVVIDEQLPSLPTELSKLKLPGPRTAKTPAPILGGGNRAREQPVGAFTFDTSDIVASPLDEDEEAEAKETIGATVAAAAHGSFDTIASEVDFMGTSNTARDVDRIFTFARTVCEGGLPVSALRRLMHERRQESSLDASVPEPRPLLPAMAAGDGLERIGDDDDGDAGAAAGDAKHTVLERVAIDAAKAANDDGSAA